MRKFVIFILLVLLIGIVGASKFEDSGDKIFLKSRTIEKVSQKMMMMNSLAEKSSSARHAIVQFEKVLSDEEKRDLEDIGVKFDSYIPDKAYFVSLPEGFDENMEGISQVVDIQTNDKISADLLERMSEYCSECVIKIHVNFFKDITKDKMQSILGSYGEILSSFDNKYIINVKKKEIDSLLDYDEVKYVSFGDFIKISRMDQARISLGVDTVFSSDYLLNGTGVVVAEWDEGWVNSTHVDLVGRVIIGDNSIGGNINCNVGGTCAPKNHSTHVGGIMMSNGLSTSGVYSGIAPNATLITYSWPNDDAETIAETNDSIKNNSILSQNSWGWEIGSCAGFGEYDSVTELYDELVWGLYSERSMSIVFAAGNDGLSCGSYGTIGGPGATAKNIITVGSYDTNDFSISVFSSRGPTDDGRIKPDVVGPGCEYSAIYNYANPARSIWSTFSTLGYHGSCGTSMSSPAVSGVIILMQEYYWRYYTDTNMSPSMVKGLLLHTATDLGNAGPDYIFGYGAVNATKALDYIRQSKTDSNLFNGTFSSTGEFYEYNVTVFDELKATLVWTDYASTDVAAVNLVNDLDLIVYNSTGDRLFPWTLDKDNPADLAVQTVKDNINNVEQVFSSNSGGGVIRIRINATSISQSGQDFSLIVNSDIGSPNITIVYPDNNSYVLNNSFVNITSNEDLDVAIIEINQTNNFTMVGSGRNYTYSLENLTLGNVYTYRVFGNDTYGNMGLSEERSLNMSNNIPTVVNLTINSSDSQNRTNSTLIIDYAILDQDHTEHNVSVNWTKNGESTTYSNLTYLAPGNTSRGDNWTVFVMVTDGINWSDRYNATITILNTAPQLNTTLMHYSYNETDLINISLNVTDIDGEEFNVSITPTRFVNNSWNFTGAGEVLLEWNTSGKDSGTQEYTILLNDSFSFAVYLFNITINESEDNDNDGINDSIDYLIGNSTSVNSSVSLNISVNGTTNLSQFFNQTLNVSIKKNSTSIIEFNWTFNSTNKLNLSGVTIIVQDDDATNGSIVVKGLNITGTKTLYMDRILNLTYVCVKDAEIDSISNISDGCNDTNEFFINCTATYTSDGYYCNYTNNTFTIKGLNHSGVVEECRDRDGDGYTDIICGGTDCDDTSSSVNPGASETCGNGIDDDCSGGDSTCSTSPPPSGGGGTAASAPSNPNQKVQSWVAFQEGIRVLRVNRGNISLTNMTMDVKNSVGDVRFTITNIESNKYSDKFKNKWYELIEVNHTNLENGDFNGIDMEFKINKTWIFKNNLLTVNIRLYRYVNSWMELSTRYVKSDNEYSYFKANSPGLSYFLIGEKMVTTTTTTTTTTSTTIVTTTSTTTTNAVTGQMAMDNVTRRDVPTEENKWSKYVLMILYVVLGGYFVIFILIRQEKNIRTFFKKGDDEKKLKPYIIKELKKGFTPKEVKDKLVKAGWSKKKIDSIIKEVK